MRLNVIGLFASFLTLPVVAQDVGDVLVIRRSQQWSADEAGNDPYDS